MHDVIWDVTSYTANLRDTRLMIVLLFALLLGLGVAIALYLLWANHAIAPESQQAFNVIALAICPAFILAVVMGPASDTLSKILLVGCIVSGNGFLYAGVAAFVYFLAGVFFGKRRRTRKSRSLAG